MLKKVKSKVIFSIIALSIIVMVSTNTYLANTLHKLSQRTTEESLGMLSESIFQTLTGRHALRSQKVVEETLHVAGTIKGIKSLSVSKSHAVIDLFSKNEPFTTDLLVQNVLNTKQTKVIESIKKNHHTIRMIKPIIARAMLKLSC